MTVEQIATCINVYVHMHMRERERLKMTFIRNEGATFINILQILER